MKKLFFALMLCFVSITCSAYVSSLYAFGALKSTGECVPKSYNWENFNSVEWGLLSDNDKMVLMMGKETQLMFMISREYTDTKNGVKVFEAVEGQTGAACKLYYYLNEAATKEFSKEGVEKCIYELDIYDYMNRTIISVLLMNVN